MKVRKSLNIAVVIFALVFLSGSALAYNTGGQMNFARFAMFSSEPILEIIDEFEAWGHEGAEVSVGSPSINSGGDSGVSIDINFGRARVDDTVFIRFRVRNNSPRPLPVMLVPNNTPEWLNIQVDRIFPNPVPADGFTEVTLRFSVHTLDGLVFDSSSKLTSPFTISVAVDLFGGEEGLVAIADPLIPLAPGIFTNDGGSELIAIALPMIPLGVLEFAADDSGFLFVWWMFVPLLLVPPFIFFNRKKTQQISENEISENTKNI